MFNMISFKANGERIESVNEKPAFFALTWNGGIVDYYGTLEAFHIGLEAVKYAQSERRQVENARIDTIEFKIAA